MVYSCSGASNVGQLANDIAINIVESGRGSMGCLVGLGAHVSTMVQNAKASNKILVIDGCAVKCGRKTLEHAGLANFDTVVLTDMGVKKTYDLKGDLGRVNELTNKVVAKIAWVKPLANKDGPTE
ncbi:MAG TPA: putative zinc-binding protein [Methanomassiliicoccales archaeon]|nr:putative zinc-binding protein [Methanomassiliicoccales archaeon]